MWSASSRLFCKKKGEKINHYNPKIYNFSNLENKGTIQDILKEKKL